MPVYDIKVNRIRPLKQVGNTCWIACMTMLLGKEPRTGRVLGARAAGRVQLNSGTLNVRSGPSTNFAIVASLRNGTQVTILGERQGGFYQIDYPKAPERNIFVSKNYVRVTSKGGAGLNYTQENLWDLANINGLSIVRESGNLSVEECASYLQRGRGGFAAIGPFDRNRDGQIDSVHGVVVKGLRGDTKNPIGISMLVINPWKAIEVWAPFNELMRGVRQLFTWIIHSR